MMMRRLRGILRTTIAGGLAWSALGLLLGALFQLKLGPATYVALGREVPGGLATACAIAGALVGIANGLAFSFLVVATERGKRIEQLRRWRFGLWGTVATGLPVGLLLQSPLIAGIGGAIGAAGALATLWLARRAQLTELPAASTGPVLLHKGP